VRKSTVGNGAKTRVSLYLWQRAFEWWTTGLWRIAPAEDMIASWRQMPGLGHERNSKHGGGTPKSGQEFLGTLVSSTLGLI
jgi:hypothetical protein